MTEEDDKNSKDLTDLSDEEMQELSEEIVDAVPEALGQAMGIDLFEELDEEGREEFEEELPEQIEELLTGFRDAMSKESDKKQAVAMFDVYNQMTEQYILGEDARGDFESGMEFLIDQLRISLEASRESMEELGYVEYFDLVYDFAVDIFEASMAGEVKEFFDTVKGSSQQAVLQRVMNPVIMEYYEYIEGHPEITDSEEARRYIEMSGELAELTTNLLPQFIAILQIVSGREETFEELKQMNLNNLLQKLGSKKYSRFNILAEGIDRELRNSVAHREFTIDPIKEEIEFRDRGELVDKLGYSEFQEKVFNILALFNALLVFRLILTYYRILHLPRVIDDLREEIAEE